MNFDPTTQEGGSGVGTILGSITIDTSNLTLTNIDLTETTNTSATIGGGFGSPTFTSYSFESSTGSAAGTVTSGQGIAFGGLPYFFVGISSECCFVDGVNVGPGFQFDFAQQGSAVQPGNFDSVTSENRFLYGTVTPADVAAAAPEPSTWAMMFLGFAALGFAGYRPSKKTSIALIA
jgi:hypothetical protein